MCELTDKMVSHPSHYQSKSGLEVIDVIEAFTDVESYAAGNVIKYVCRYKNKNGVQDLEKAMWYLQYLIEYLEKKDEEKRVELTLEKYREYMYGIESE